MDCPPLATYERVASGLSAVAPTYLGRKFLAQHDAPRRYVWVFTGEESGGAARVGGNPRSRHTDRWSIAVHCWGADFEEAYRLRQALVTELRASVKGANYQLGRTAIVSDDEHTALGAVFVVSLTLITPLADATFPGAAPAPIEDDVHTTGQALVAELDAGDVRATGTSPPALTLSGRPLVPLRGRVAIDAPGPLGAATFRYSLDNGVSWEGANIPTASDYPLAGTGVVVHFAAGDYQSDNTYVFSNVPPQRGDGWLDVLEE